MTDPRIGLGLEVELEVAGPYEVKSVHRDGTGMDGDELDVGIVARTVSGKRIVIGEIWAACLDEDDGKTRIDAEAVATRIVDALNWVLA